MLPQDSNREQWFAYLQHELGFSDKSWWTTFWLSLFFGYFGADRFYLGGWVLGLLKLCTMGGLGFWWIIDIILLLLGLMCDENGKRVKRPFWNWH